MVKIKLSREAAGHYTAEAAGHTWEIMHSGPECWSFWPQGDPSGADAYNTLGEVRQALATIEAGYRKNWEL